MAARRKLAKLEAFVREEMRVPMHGVEEHPDRPGDDRTLDVVPVSAKFSLNLRKVVRLMRDYVEEAREKKGIDSEAVGRLLHA